MLELLIKGGRMLDGSANVVAPGDVAITADRIEAIGRGLGQASRTLDARGCLVLPGFIDSHTHSDFTLPLAPGAPAKLLQGITTDVTGNCGFSPFPLEPGLEGKRHGVFLEPNLTERWLSLSAYRADLEDLSIAINIAPLVGLGAVRLQVMGADSRRQPTTSELAQMQAMVRQALQEGAFGASSGLVYAPGAFAEVSELAALASEVAANGGVYATHMRDEGDGLGAALDEALETARRSGCSLQVSHIKAFGRRNWGGVRAALSKIDQAVKEGVDVWTDVYPYTAGATSLSAALPAVALAGGEEELRRRLREPAERAALARLAEDNREKSLDDVILGTIPHHPELAGLRLRDAAARRRIRPVELLLQIIEESGVAAVMMIEGMGDGDLESALKHGRALFGSDGWVMTVDREAYAHPRNFAAAVRLLVQYVRDKKVIGLAHAVAMLASGPARRFRLKDRGLLALGAAADVVVIDLDNMDEVADFRQPCRYPTGVRHVVVNGAVAVEDGHITGVRAGRVLQPALC